jgi:hypothetical protein
LNTTNKREKGIIYSLDALISFLIMLFACLVFAVILANNATQLEKNIYFFELEEKAMLIADSLVKNLDTNNSLLGACTYNTNTKRVESNKIDLELLFRAKQIDSNKFIVKRITVNDGKKTELNLSSAVLAECIAVKRFVLADGKKAVIEVETCRK